MLAVVLPLGHWTLVPQNRYALQSNHNNVKNTQSRWCVTRGWEINGPADVWAILRALNKRDDRQSDRPPMNALASVQGKTLQVSQSSFWTVQIKRTVPYLFLHFWLKGQNRSWVVIKSKKSLVLMTSLPLISSKVSVSTASENLFITNHGSISVSGQPRTYPSPNPTCCNKLIS